MATIDTQIQLKRGLSTDWAEKNPVLLAAEIGVEIDTNKFKIGDGTTAWNSLAYQGADLSNYYTKAQTDAEIEAKGIKNGAGLIKTTINNEAAPVLSANGTMGGDTEACSADYDESNAWQAYANSSSLGWKLHCSSYDYEGTKSSSTYYTPEAKTLASLSIIYNNTQPVSQYYSIFSAIVKGSLDGSTWETIGSFKGVKPEVVYTPITFVPTTFGQYKYFKTEFTVTGQYYVSEPIRINLQFGTPAYAVDVDDNTIRINSKNKIYAPTILQEVDLPLAYDSLTVGGMTNYSITNGYLVPTYKSNLSFSYYSGQGYVAVYNSTVSTPSTVAEAFTQTSYIDIPCDVGKMVKDVQAGRRNSVNCVFSSLVGSSGYQSIAWIGGKSDGTTFTPLLFGSISDMGGGVAFLTGGYTTGGQYENGFTVDSTSTTYGSTDLNGGAGLSITYDGTNWKVLCSGIDPMMMSAYDYHTTAVTSSQVDKLAEINVMRFVNQYGSNTVANNPMVDGFGYNNSSWTPSDGAVTTYTLAVKYDNDTVFLNGSGELSAQGGGGSTRNVGEIVTSALPIVDQGLHLLDGSELSGDGIYEAFVTYIAGLYGTGTPPDYFCSEADWQAAVTAKGVCGKFVYTAASGNDPAKVRLPLITGLTRHINSITNLGDVVTDIETSASGDINSTKLVSYIAVADTNKSNIQVDIDNIVTDLESKVDYSTLLDAHVVISTGKTGTNWYRLYSDGWCEQGGTVVCVADTNTAVSLLQEYEDTNYVAIATYNDTTSGEVSGVAAAINLKAVDGFSIGSPGGTYSWQTSGFAATT